MKEVKLFGSTFKTLLTEEEILKSIQEVAKKMDESLEEENLLFLVILKGAAMFAMDLIKALDIDPETEFIRAKSYIGMQSSGNVDCDTKSLDVKGKHVIIIEDIVETGNTIEALDQKLMQQGAEKVEVATLFFKSDVYKKEKEIKYVGRKIPSDFVVGYGLDYDEKGRGLRDLYAKA